MTVLFPFFHLLPFQTFVLYNNHLPVFLQDFCKTKSCFSIEARKTPVSFIFRAKEKVQPICLIALSAASTGIEPVFPP
jgi:hypothetical protein